MIKAIIIDDEENARFLLKDLLSRHFNDEISVIAEADDVDTGIEAIQGANPDLVFLDIQMQKGTGFDLLARLDEHNFEVIFITAYDAYALKAFDFSAFAYMLKPIRVSELRKHIDRLKKRVTKEDTSTDKRLKVLIDNYNDEEGRMKRLVIKNMEGFRVVDLKDIIRLEAESNYSHFILSDGKKVTVSKTLGEYEALLAEHGFFRIHQSHIVNLQHVISFLKADGGKVEMRDGTQLMISRQKKAAFTRRFV